MQCFLPYFPNKDEANSVYLWRVYQDVVKNSIQGNIILIFMCSKFRRFSTKSRIDETMTSDTPLTDRIDKILGTSDFSLLMNDWSFKWLLISRKQVNNDLVVSLISVTLLELLNVSCTMLKTRPHLRNSTYRNTILKQHICRRVG